MLLSQFKCETAYFAKVFEKITIVVNPQYISQECSSWGAIVKKTLSTRPRVCKCGCVMDRDENAARNILKERIGYGRAYRNFCA